MRDTVRKARTRYLLAATAGVLAAGTLMAPQAMAASVAPEVSAQLIPQPPPPAIPPPRCVPENQSPRGSQYEWTYLGTKKLKGMDGGSVTTHEFMQSHTGPVKSPLELSVKVSCTVEREGAGGRAGDGLDLPGR
jgi:hypothetical protein